MSPSRIASTRTRRAALRLGVGSLTASLMLQRQPPVMVQAEATPGANKALVHALFENGINGGDLAASMALYAPGVLEGDAADDELVGWGGLPLSIAQFHAQVPDTVATIDEVVVEGDAVAVRVTWRGPHPPAGTHLVGRTLHVFHVANGQIGAQWSAGWEWLA